MARRCLLSRGLRNPCQELALPGDVVCEFHAEYFRRGHLAEQKCAVCGRRLVGSRSRWDRRCFPSCEQVAEDVALSAAIWRRMKEERIRG